MAWTTPRTWVTSELVTASIMNTHVRDNLSFLKSEVEALRAAKPIIFSIGRVGGGVISTGVKGYAYVPAALTVTGWTLFANTTGSMVIDVWAEDYAASPPTVADTIAGTEKPTLSAAQKAQDTSLTSWGAIAAGDVLGFNVDSCSTISQATLTLHCALA